MREAGMSDVIKELVPHVFEAAIQACELALLKHGPEVQEVIAVGEIGELLTALARLRQGRGTAIDIVEEAADVMLCALQVGMVYGGTDGIVNLFKAKTARLLYRLNEGQ